MQTLRERRIAVMGDIHGNLPALEAVVADMARRNVERVINLGDHASGPLWPRETVAYIMQTPWINLSGNCDRAIREQAFAEQGPSHRYAYEQLGAVEKDWLDALPTLSLLDQEMLIFHGIPGDDDTYLLETVELGVSRLARPAEITARLAGVTAPVILCAHSHIPRVVRVGDALIVNPGSVGLPAYEHDKPDAHVMEVGSPDARYAILAQTLEGWQVELIALAYDQEAAAVQARRNARPDWERALRFGFMLD